VQYESLNKFVSDDLLERFTHEAAALGVTVHRPAAREAAVAVTLDLLRTAGAGEFLAWDAGELPLPGVLDAARAAGLQPRSVALPADAAGRAAALAELERARGLTGALGALAAARGAAQQPRPAAPGTLLPPVHWRCWRKTLPGDGGRCRPQPQAVRAGASLVFVSGPGARRTSS
jgi:hypothetical protein